jgi:hypothetical protein
MPTLFGRVVLIAPYPCLGEDHSQQATMLTVVACGVPLFVNLVYERVDV